MRTESQTTCFQKYQLEKCYKSIKITMTLKKVAEHRKMKKANGKSTK